MDQVTLVKNQYRLEQWTRLIQDCQSSGMRVDDWCEANGVTHHAYYYWLRKVRKAACQDLSVTSEMESSTHFKQLEVQLPAANTQAAVIIHLPSAALEIQNGAAQQTVEAVLLALKSICQVTSRLQEKSAWPAVTQTCANPLMDWRLWLSSNST